MTTATQALSDLYTDPKSCASLIGLHYASEEDPGYTRTKQGKQSRIIDILSEKVVGVREKARIDALVIPPAWQEVWISKDKTSHILATGIDEKGRKQYIYHPDWRTSRDLMKFYRMVLFARVLPKIRQCIDNGLKKRSLEYDKVLATMLWILDNAYIRIGNEAYYALNESVGLTTLTKNNVVIAGSVVTLAFTGKSGKDQQITFDNGPIAKILKELKEAAQTRLFCYTDAAGDWHPIDAEDINRTLHEVTQAHVSAKDFRTWGGTLLAFMHLLEEEDEKKKIEKTVIEAVDQAAAVLGNTRTVAKSSYIHPHMLQLYGSKDFNTAYAKARKGRKVPGLDRTESDLYYFLQQLFENQFSLLKSQK